MRRSLRARYVLEITSTMVLSLTLFGVAVMGALAIHFYLQARADGTKVAETVASSLPPASNIPGDLFFTREVLEATAATGGRARVYDRKGHLLATAPIPRGWPPPSLSEGFQMGRVAVVRSVVRTKDVIVAVEIPVRADLDVLRDTAVSLIILLAVSALVVWALARRSVTHVLLPVDRMTRRAREMLVSGQIMPFPQAPGGPDEFTRLADVLTDLTRDLEARRLRDRHLLTEAAHELRTPLQVIKGNLSFLHPLSGAAPEVQRESFDSLDRAVARMSRLSEDLLMLEHAAAPSRSLESIDIPPLLREMQEDLAAAYPERKVTVSSAGDGLLVDADRQKLQRILWVLVENAHRYSPPEGELRIEAARTPEGMVAIAVKDEGPGIPPDEIGRVFERFFRGRRGRAVEGTGLGLAIARASATSMGATLTLENRPEGGTAATLTLVPKDTSSRAQGPGWPEDP